MVCSSLARNVVGCLTLSELVVIFRTSIRLHHKQSQLLLRYNRTKKSDKTRAAAMKTQENYLGLARRYFRGKSWDVSEKKAEQRTTDCSYQQLVDTEVVVVVEGLLVFTYLMMSG